MGHSFSSGCSSSSSRAGGLCRPLKVPRRLCCPITRKIMRQPVTLGIHTFEREAIEKHLSRYNTNPMTSKLFHEYEVKLYVVDATKGRGLTLCLGLLDTIPDRLDVGGPPQRNRPHVRQAGSFRTGVAQAPKS